MKWHSAENLCGPCHKTRHNGPWDTILQRPSASAESEAFRLAHFGRLFYDYFKSLAIQAVPPLRAGPWEVESIKGPGAEPSKAGKNTEIPLRWPSADMSLQGGNS